MREVKFSKEFEKKLNKLKGQEFQNVINKIDEISNYSDLNHYKNLKYDLKKFKRVHVNTSYVIIFYDELNKIIYFHNYAHHDEIYKK